MKRLLLLFLLCIPAIAQPFADCNYSGTFTSAVAGSTLTNAIVPGGTGAACAVLRFNYQGNGFSALSIQVESAPYNSAGTGPGTFAVISTDIVSGNNPSTVTGSATLLVQNFFAPFLRVRVTSVTGTGTIKWNIYGSVGVKGGLASGGGTGPTGPVGPPGATGPAGSTGATGGGLSGLTTNAIMAAASATTAATPSATTTLDSSGNIATQGSVTTGNGSSTTGNVALKGKTSGNTVNLTVADTTAAATITYPGSTGAGLVGTGTITSGHCAQFTGTVGAVVDAGAACGSGSGGAANPSCTFNAAAIACGTPSTINVAPLAAPTVDQLLVQCFTIAGSIQTQITPITYTQTTGSGIVQTVAPAFASAGAAGYCAVNGNGSGGTGGGAITSTAFASLPGTCTSGSLFLFTDTIYTQALCGASNVYTYQTGYGLATPPPTSGWTTANTGGGTFAANHGTWEVTGVTFAGATQLAASYRTAPATPFTLDVQILNEPQFQAATKFEGAAIGVRDSAGKYVIFIGGLSFNSNQYYANTEIWSSATTRTSTPSTFGPVTSQGGAMYLQNPQFYRMVVSSTTITFFVSLNQGLTYAQFGSSITISGNLADTQSIVFGLQNEDATTAGAALTSWLTH